MFSVLMRLIIVFEKPKQTNTFYCFYHTKRHLHAYVCVYLYEKYMWEQV